MVLADPFAVRQRLGGGRMNMRRPHLIIDARTYLAHDLMQHVELFGKTCGSGTGDFAQGPAWFRCAGLAQEYVIGCRAFEPTHDAR